MNKCTHSQIFTRVVKSKEQIPQVLSANLNLEKEKGGVGVIGRLRLTHI